MSLTKRARLNVESLDLRIVPAVVDLTTPGSGAALGNGAIVHRNDAAWNNANGALAHGRGVMNSFLSIDANGTEEGYNTTVRPFQLDQVRNGTTALTLGQVPVVTVGGKTYREFTLDIQEPGSKARSLSVDEVRVYVAGQNNLQNYNANNGKLGGQSPVFDLDSAGNVTVMLRSMVNQGSRVSEMALLVPTSAFAGKANNSFVYLYSKMGATAGAGAGGGAEHWGTRQGPPASPPPPPPPANGSVTGRVFADSNQDGNFDQNGVDDGNGTLYLPDVPLGGVTVTLSAGSTVLTTVTDVDGNYTFSNVAPGTYSLVESPVANDVYVPGMAWQGTSAVGVGSPISVTVSANQTSSGNVLTESGGSISGLTFFDANQTRTTDAEDHVIAGVIVELHNPNDPNYPGDTPFLGVSNAKGVFKFVGLAAGSYSLIEESPDVFAFGAAFQGVMDDPAYSPPDDGSIPDPSDRLENIGLAAGQQALNYTFTSVFGE